ncbi:hypothetical protein [Methanobrevibacter millerae]|uniref:Uncharacterized protein n=1 Tax=Methanobrevibacter millerae TaxID=230361 RepID=A0A1G5V9D4_9EURY|nr:hypothetical protein [Methanobrevibacter millerae]SDA42470.1 hypothetical protein SAMN02910315_00449 [Methanobrevibacter millerae]
MGNIDDLKDYDDKLIYFIIFNISLFLLINYNFKTIVDCYGIISLFLSVPVLYLPVYLLNNIIPADWKFWILYYNKNPHRFASDIFTRLRQGKIKYNKKDIDLNLIFKNYRTPNDSFEEDSLWYEIYQKNRYDPKVYQQHKLFLLSRDFTAIILPLTMLFSIVVYYLGISLDNIFIFLGISLIEIVIFRYIAIKQNEKFALSVLQEETYSLKEEKNGNIEY